MVAFPLNSSVTASQGSSGSLSNAWPFVLTDLTNILGTTAHPLFVSSSQLFSVSGTVAVQGNVNVTQGTTPWQVSSSQTFTVQGAPGMVPVGVSGTTTANQGASGSTAWKVDGSAFIQPVSGTNTLNIQGVVGGQAISVSGTLTANQGTPASLTNAWPIQIVSSSNVANVNRAGQVSVTLDNSSSLPLSIVYDQTVAIAGAFAIAGTWFKGVYYTIPANFKYTFDTTATFAADVRSALRIAKILPLATFNMGTLAFVASSSYVTPQFASFLEVELTTTSSNGTNVVLNISYTNQAGVAGQTATATIQKNATAGTKVLATLSSNDFGVLSVQSVTTGSGGPLQGLTVINGGIMIRNDPVSVASQVATLTHSYITLRPNDVLALDYGSPGGAGTVERFVRVTGVLIPT